MFLWSWPMAPFWPGGIGPHCLYILHISCRHGAYHETAHDCAPHGSIACGLTHAQESIFYQDLSCQQGSYLKDHGLLTNCLWLLSAISNARLPHRPLFRVVPFTCISWAWSSQALLGPLVAYAFTHPCPGRGFSYPPTHQPKQGLAGLTHAEWCMILCTKCVYEPSKSSTTFEWSPYIYLILNDGKHPEIEFILLHLEDNEAMANDFSGEVTTLKCTHLI